MPKLKERSPEEIAEQRIQAALELGTTLLDLGGLGLLELPASMGQVTPTAGTHHCRKPFVVLA